MMTSRPEVHFGVERISEKIANYGAGAAVASPWWLPSLHQVSEVASELLPIAGLLWLLFQFGLKLYDRYKFNQKEEED